jgi:hypothetical protein
MHPILIAALPRTGVAGVPMMWFLSSPQAYAAAATTGTT